jgi:DNA-binding beta-propeller fold protein YncE
MSGRGTKYLSLLTLTLTCALLLPVQTASDAGASSSLEFDAPSGLVFGGGHLWVTNEAGNSVSEINPTNGAWLTTIAAQRDGFAQPTAITLDGPYLFVANGGGSVTELRASTGAFVRRLSGPHFHFVDPVAITSAGSFVLVLNAGRSNGVGSITELRASTGKAVRTIAGPSFALLHAAAFSVSGPDVFVADKGDNSVTEVNIANGRLVRVVAQQGLDLPDGIAVVQGNAWVADSGSNAATEIDAATGAVIGTETDSDGSYGFGAPLMVIGSGGNVFVASPFGASPMVTKLSATTGQPSWYMCNTNGPYYFSLLSAFAISGTDLWVASRSGANSHTPSAQTGSLTELSTGDGSLIATYPQPTSTPTTTTSTTTTLP